MPSSATSLLPLVYLFSTNPIAGGRGPRSSLPVAMRARGRARYRAIGVEFRQQSTKVSSMRYVFLLANRRLPLPSGGGSPASRTSLPLPPVARFAIVGPTGRLWTGRPVGIRRQFSARRAPRKNILPATSAATRRDDFCPQGGKFSSARARYPGREEFWAGRIFTQRSAAASASALARSSGSGEATSSSAPVTGWGKRRRAAWRNWRSRP